MKNEENSNSKKSVISAEDTSLFCSQLAMILKSGIHLQDGISAIGETIANPKARKIVEQLGESVSSNTPLHQALRQSGFFPKYMVNMIEVGEKSGKLDEVMDALAIYYHREDQLKKNIRSAIFYPVILVLMMSAVIAILVIQVLPIFNQVFDNLGSDLSVFSTVMLKVGVGIARYSFFVILALLIIALAAFFYSRTAKGAAWFAKVFSRIGPTKKISAKIASARFASVMAMMLSSGYDTDQAMELAPKVVSNDLIANKILQVRQQTAEGKSFTEAIIQAELFPGIYGRMVSVGTRVGSLDTVMTKLAELYNEEADRSINRAVSLIEPVLVGILSVIIGAILLSVMLPLVGIMSSIG